MRSIESCFFRCVGGNWCKTPGTKTVRNQPTKMAAMKRSNRTQVTSLHWLHQWSQFEYPPTR